MINEKNAQIILTIFQTKNISKAAQLLYTSQPALSRSLKNMERELGFQIFDRTKTPLELTEKGKVYLHYLRRWKDLESEMERQLQEMDQREGLELKVSALPFLSIELFPKIIPLFIRENPQVKLQFSNYNRESYESSLLREEIDLLISNFPPDNQDLHYKILHQDPLFLICNRTASLEKKYDLRENSKEHPTQISLHDFSNYTFYLLEPFQNLRMLTDEIFQTQSFTPKEQIIVPNIVAAASMLNGDLDATFLTQSCLHYISLNKNVLFFTLENFHNTASIGIIYKRYKKTRLMDSLCSIISQVLQDHII